MSHGPAVLCGVFQFGVVWQDFDKLLLGAWLTLRLSALAMVFGLTVGILGALARNARWRLRRGHRRPPYRNVTLLHSRRSPARAESWYGTAGRDGTSRRGHGRAVRTACPAPFGATRQGRSRPEDGPRH
jgi:hypothetical protein